SAQGVVDTALMGIAVPPLMVAMPEMRPATVGAAETWLSRPIPLFRSFDDCGKGTTLVRVDHLPSNETSLPRVRFVPVTWKVYSSGEAGGGGCEAFFVAMIAPALSVERSWSLRAAFTRS